MRFVVVATAAVIWSSGLALAADDLVPASRIVVAAASELDQSLQQALSQVITSLLTIATTTPGSPFEKRKSTDLAFEGGRVFVKDDGPDGGVPFAKLLQRANLRLVTGSGVLGARDGEGATAAG